MALILPVSNVTDIVDRGQAAELLGQVADLSILGSGAGGGTAWFARARAAICPRRARRLGGLPLQANHDAIRHEDDQQDQHRTEHEHR
jgi:hypothetical protein